MKWDKADLDSIKEIVRAAESYLAAQLDLATSADQRAATLASAFTLAGAGLVAGLITLAAASEHWRLFVPVYAGGGITALMFLIAAWICVRTTMPVEFWLAGNEPANWQDDVERSEKLEKMLGDQATNYQKCIEGNDVILKGNARAFKWGARLGVGAPFVGAVVWLLMTVNWCS